MLKIIIFVVLSLLTIQVCADTNGIYEGMISMNPDVGRTKGRNLPIVISLRQTKTEMPPANSNSIFFAEKKVEGSFVLDGESIPYAFASSEYDPESGNLILQYGRLGTTGAPSSIPNLTFECVLFANGTCNGTLTSGINGVMGTFALKQTTTTVTQLSPVPKYVGDWVGTITYSAASLAKYNLLFPDDPKPPTEDFHFSLAAGSGSVPNPDNYEIASTPMKIGSDYEGSNAGSAFTYSSVYIDYFKGEASLSATNAINGYTATKTLTVDFQDDGSITGRLDSSVWGSGMGTFVARKVK